MRKQMKIAAVVSATALLAIGASFTSMAAAKTGTWKLEEEGWVCYDKDGDLYESVFCLDGGKEYYVGDDGVLVTSDWVQDEEDNWYYVGSTGEKTVNDWRYVIPEDGEEDDEAEWFYFGSTGKVATGKKVINNNTYYFDEDGVMLTGWVKYGDIEADNKAAVVADEMSSDVVYVDENGARVASSWVKTYAPGTDEDLIEEGDAETFWYWIKSKGAVQTGRNLDINGETYYFNTEGQMLSGWVTGWDTDGNEKADTFATSSNAFAVADASVYFCGGEDQGWSKKNTWIKTWAPDEYEAADSDNDQYWYWIGKDGVVFRATENDADANTVKFVNGEIGANVKFTPAEEEGFFVGGSKIATKEINNKTYAFKENGQMWSGLVAKEEGVYYFGGSNDGAMKTGVVMIADADDYEYKFYFGEKTNDEQGYKKGVAVTGNAGGDLYINGQLRTSDYKYEEVEVFENKWFLIDADGDIRTSNKTYTDEDDNEYNHKDTDFESAKGILNGSFAK